MSSSKLVVIRSVFIDLHLAGQTGGWLFGSGRLMKSFDWLGQEDTGYCAQVDFERSYRGRCRGWSPLAPPDGKPPSGNLLPSVRSLAIGKCVFVGRQITNWLMTGEAIAWKEETRHQWCGRKGKGNFPPSFRNLVFSSTCLLLLPSLCGCLLEE